jgi:hypothetical protein
VRHAWNFPLAVTLAALNIFLKGCKRENTDIETLCEKMGIEVNSSSKTECKNLNSAYAIQSIHPG